MFTQFKNPKDKIVNNEKYQTHSTTISLIYPTSFHQRQPLLLLWGTSPWDALCKHKYIFIFSFCLKKSKLDIDNTIKIDFSPDNDVS